MSMSYTDAVNRSLIRQRTLIEAMNENLSQARINYLRGRYIRSLQAQIRIANQNGLSSQATATQNQLLVEIQTHHMNLKNMNYNNKHGNYSIVKEIGLGLSSLLTSAKMLRYSSTPQEKKESLKSITKDVGKNVKNIIKAPIVLTTKILSNRFTGALLAVPVKLGMGILHAAWNAIDPSPSPFDGKGIDNMSRGFTQVMTSLNNKVKLM